jgi:hypothetical protein
MYTLLHPARMRGRFAIVTDVGCGMRWAPRVAAWFSARTNGSDAPAKSCGPGIPVLMPSFADDDLRGDGGKRAGPRGELV